jgi:hypothetical protein
LHAALLGVSDNNLVAKHIGKRDPKASLPSCILICSSQTLASLKCKLFAGDWCAAKTASVYNPSEPGGEQSKELLLLPFSAVQAN